MEKVYLTVFDWAVEDDSGIDIDVFANESDAIQKMESIIAAEKEEGMWVGDCIARNKDDELNEDCVEERNINYWEFYKTGYRRDWHSCVSVVEKIVE